MVVHLLLKHGAQIDQKVSHHTDADGSPCYYVQARDIQIIIMRMMKMLKWMMAVMILIRIHQDEDSWTALHAAAANGHHRIAESVFELFELFRTYLKYLTQSDLF